MKFTPLTSDECCTNMVAPNIELEEDTPMADENNNISAERARAMAATSRKTALEQELPRVLANIMNRIQEATQNGNESVSFGLDEVYSDDEAHPGLKVRDLLDRVGRNLVDEHGYVVHIDGDINFITIRWNN